MIPFNYKLVFFSKQKKSLKDYIKVSRLNSIMLFIFKDFKVVLTDSPFVANPVIFLTWPRISFQTYIL